MADTHSVGPFFWSVQKLAPGAPRKSKTTAYEIEHPFRTGHADLWKLLGPLGVVVGRWHRDVNPDDDAQVQKHLLAALQSATGPDAFQAAARREYIISRALGRAQYEPTDGYLTGENDGPQQNLGQVAEHTGRVFEVDDDGNPVRELTEGML
jgi:hypothetical protein